ncbi:MAG TPA: GtrA family protein [Allosphingosinicella sp.]|nr:GtrA family protein [Allosphingosinicella sp.]
MRRPPLASRYALTAAACMVTHNLVMIAGDAAGIVMPVAVLLSFCLCVLLGFFLHSRYTFAVAGDARSLLRYTVAMAANVPLTIVLLWLFLVSLHLPMAAASPAATLVLLVVNFFASRWAILGGRRQGRPA